MNKIVTPENLRGLMAAVQPGGSPSSRVSAWVDKLEDAPEPLDDLGRDAVDTLRRMQAVFNNRPVTHMELNRKLEDALGEFLIRHGRVT